MGCECNKTQKILLGVSGLFALVGVIVVIIAQVTVSAAVSIDWEGEKTRSTTVTVPSDAADHCGFGVYFLDSVDCDAGYAGLSATHNGWTPSLDSRCLFRGNPVESDDGKLLIAAHLNVNEGGTTLKTGDYTISSSAADMWVMDYCGEIGEAVGGFFAALGLMVFAIILLVVSAILCCVTCCCGGSK